MFLSDEEEEDRIFDELEDKVAIFSGFRYSYRDNVPKNLQWYDEILPNLDERRFKMLFRCTQAQFNVILALIEGHPVFHGQNSDKQFSIQFQLALVLYRLGSNGEGATLGRIATLFGIGDGGTIEKCTSRVFESILSLENDFIKWPTADERAQLVMDTFDELPHCFAYADGTEIPLSEQPTLDPVSYFSRNSQYAIKLQSVIDHHLVLRQLNVGYPGSVHDARIYNNCRLSTSPQNYFSEHQYLAADSAYKLRTTVMTPFRKNATTLNRERREAFNKYFSSFRVRIEHFYGILKEIFPCLYNLNVRIHDETSHRIACDWVRVCCILYNILRPHIDLSDYVVNVNSNEEDDEDEDEDFVVDDDAESKRIALVQLIEEK